MNLGWTDIQELAVRLFERYDTLNPRSIKLADMRKWVLDLEDFHGLPGEGADPTLQAIQNEWYKLWAEEYGG
jgi:FeS assembly protein IscX